MSDIVERLRHVASLWEPDEKSSMQLEAAAEIERLRAALGKLLNGAVRYDECPDSLVARAALDEGISLARSVLSRAMGETTCDPQSVPGYSLDKATMTYKREGK